MTTYIEDLVNYFDGYNNVKSVSLPALNEVNMSIVESILYRTLTDNDTDIRRALNDLGTSWYNFNFSDMVRDAMRLTGNEWLNHNGRFTRRLMHNLPRWMQPYAGTIGESITRRAYNPSETTYKLSISDRIFWDDGNFGKKYSCWWGSFEESRQVFTDNNGIALLTHDNHDAYNGIARLWIAPIDNDMIFCFNQYGNDANGNAIRIEDSGRILTEIIPDSKIICGYLYNNDSDDIPYINGNTGLFVIPADSKLRDGYTEHVDWGDGEGENHEHCNNCGNRIDEDDAQYFDGDAYCQSCFDDRFIYCGICNETYRKRDATYSNTDDEYYCDSCYSEKFFECSECNCETSRDDLMEHGYSEYCPDCFNDLFFQCSNCSEFYSVDDAVRIDDDDYCATCAEEIDSQVTKTVELVTTELNYYDFVSDPIGTQYNVVDDSISHNQPA
jgi:hypothetical protein